MRHITNDPTVINGNRPGIKLVNDLSRVSDQHHRRTELIDLQQQLDDLPGVASIQIARRLISKQDLGLAHH